MDNYEIKLFKGTEEIDLDMLPDDYLNGIIKLCKEELNRRQRMDRVFSKMAENIKLREGN